MIYLILIALIGAVILQARSRVLDKRRVDILKKLNTPSNPRFGVNHRIVFSLEQLREFFDADTGFIILREEDGETCSMRQVNRKDACLKEESSAVDPKLAQMLMAFPSNSTAIFCAPRPYWKRETFKCYDVDRGKELPFERLALKKVGAFIGVHFMSIPLISHKQTVGRIFITSRRRCFSRTDVDFIFQVTNQILASIENMKMVARLADESAEEERQRIARDIHDSIIQPYIGLQMAIEAMRQKFVVDDKGLLRDVEHLDRMCREGTQELRAYVNELKNGGGGESSLLPAVHRFANKFTLATGIDVKVESSPDFSIHDGLASHVFQMTVEGLSNVHRHTQAESAAIRLGCDKKRLLLQIENSGDESGGTTHSFSGWPKERISFTPRSISERAHSLGGTVNVETHQDGRAVISIDIPL
ncbi:sensor histidine kinase LiaS [Abditibacteriota bacterium]|nr:sensor histidine kinase LiaS [Abditibacteriota bacterium]